MKRTPLADRFWPKVDKRGPNECWPWTANTNSAGYGMIGIGNGSRKSDFAHRVSYQLAHGAIPAGMNILHRCDNPLCVNPAHLFLGTHAQNMRDMADKGRNKPCSLPGSKNPNAKLTDDQVRAIRSDTRRQVDIAAEYGIGQTAVSKIKRGEKWRHV